MTKYALYLESGPRHRKTMLHVLPVLGCTVQGSTTTETVDAAPAAIRTYLHFLQRHGEDVLPEADLEVEVAEHITQGVWLGYGDPTPGFSFDFLPLTPEDLKTYVRHLGWMRSDLLEQIGSLPAELIHAEPHSKGRSINQILLHIAEGDATYLRYLVGKVDHLADASRAVQENSTRRIPALIYFWEIVRSRLEELTGDELSQKVPHGQVTWTARRALRRMLEHTWEHLQEINTRLADHQE